MQLYFSAVNKIVAFQEVFLKYPPRPRRDNETRVSRQVKQGSESTLKWQLARLRKEGGFGERREVYREKGRQIGREGGGTGGWGELRAREIGREKGRSVART
eukprot:1599862-Pleurochrysis_carterae.AAC.1